MGKMRTWLVMFLSALFLCCAAVFAVGVTNDRAYAADGLLTPTKIEVTAEQGEAVIYSSESSLSTYGQYFEGTITFDDGSTSTLDQYAEDCSVVSEPLRPGKDEDISAGQTYQREFWIRLELNGQTYDSNHVQLTVTADEIDHIVVQLTGGGSTFNAGTTIDDDRIRVVVFYKNGILPYTAAPGEFEIEYNNGEDLAFGDTSVKIVYKEGAQSITEPLDGLTVREMPINAPYSTSAGDSSLAGTLTNLVYDGEGKSKTFDRFDAERMTITTTDGLTVTYGDGTITFTATEVDTYSVTFTVKEGFQWRESSIPNYGQSQNSTEPDKTDQIVSVTYTWKVVQAEFTGIEFDFTADGWTYIGQNQTGLSNADKAPKNITAHYDMANGEDHEIAITDENGNVAEEFENAVSIVYEKQNGDTWTQVQAEDLKDGVPNDAGSYRVKVEIAETDNFEKAESDYTNFTIAKAKNTVTYTGATWQYGETPVTLAQIKAGLSSAFDTDLGTVDDGDIVVTLTYNNSDDAFTISDNSLAWNVGIYYLHVYYPGNDNVEAVGTTAAPAQLSNTGTINVTKGTIYFDGTLSMEGWTYGDTADTPSGVTVSVGGDNERTELDASTVGGYVFSTAADGTYSDWDAFFAANDSTYDGGAALNAGTYYVRYHVNSTGNYDAANGEATSFTVSRRTVTKPTFADNATTHTSTYDEESQTVTVNNFNADIMNGSASGAEGDSVSFNNAALTATNADTYTLTITLQGNNYTWTGEGQNPNDTPSTVTLTWTIDKAQNEITAADTFAGWTYGNMPTSTDALNAQLAFTADEQEIVYTFYNSDNEAVTIGNTTPAGEYTLVLSVEGTANTLGCEKTYNFTVGQGTATIEASLEDTATWFYKDDLSEHELTARGTVTGSADLEFDLDDCDVQYQHYNGSGWEDVTLSQDLGAGNYRVVISLKDATNYTADDVTIEFTIQKYVVVIPTFVRSYEFTGEAIEPDVSTSGARGSSWSVAYETEDSTNYGLYWLTLTLHDSDNYVWGTNYLESFYEGSEIKDCAVGENAVKLFYTITKTTYTATVVTSNFTYGDTIKTPTLEINLEGDALKEVAAATPTYYYQIKDSGGDWIEFEGQTLDAGVYQWYVYVPSTENFSYGNFYGDFTVNPKVLGEPQWSGLETTYGTANEAEATFSGVLEGNDLNLTYTYSGTANDGTQYNSSTAPTKAGSYTVTVTIGNNNYVLSGTWASPVRTSSAVDYVINKLEITLQVDEIEAITFGENAPTYSYSLVGSLPYGENIADVLRNAGITVMYEDNYAAGNAATTYTVSITNAFTLANYTVTTQTGTLTVKPFELEVTITDLGSDLTYDGSAKTASYTTNIPSGFAGTQPELTLSYQVQGNGSEWSDLEGTPTDVGTYRAVVTMAENGNYTYTTTEGTAFTITNATISVEELSTDNIWYTGDAYELADYLTISTVNGQTYNLTFTVNSSTVTELTAAGEYTVNYTITAPNHTTETGSFTLNIQKNTLVWSTEYDRDDWTYGGTATNETTPVAKFANGTAATGIIGEATIEYFTDEDCTSAYTGTFDNTTAAGTYYVKVSVAGTANYTGCEKVYSFTVARAQLTIAANSITGHVYNTAAPDYTATITGFVNDESAESLGIVEGDEYTLSCEYAAGDSVGQYTIEVKAGSTEIPNYTVTYQSGTLEVVAQGLDYNIGELTAEQRTYSGNPIAYPITATGADDKQSVVLTVYYQEGDGERTKTAPTDAGTYTVTAVAADGYTASGWSATFTILPREVDVAWTQTDTTFIYNGTEQDDGIAASYNLWIGGSESDSTASMTVTLTSGGNTFTDAGDYTFTASFTRGSYDSTYGYLSADGNYCMADTNGGRTQGYSIGQRPITVTVTPQSREYGDGFDIPESAVNVTTTADDGKQAVITGDAAYTLQVTDANGVALSGTPDVDTYYIRLVETLTDKNYAVTLESSTPGSGDTVLYEITQREITISFTGDTNVIYGNNVDENALRDLIAFSRTNGSGDAFLGKDSAVQADVLAALNFNLGGYTVTSNAGSTFNITISGMNNVDSDGNYTFAYSGAEAKLTVDKRPITFAINSQTGLTYGTDAVWEAFDSLSATLTSGTFANGHNAGNVYTLGVYMANGTQITDNWASLAVGTYYIVGTAINENYAVTFTGDANYDGGTGNAGTFEVVASEIVVTVNSSTEVWYTGGEYVLLDGSALSAFATDVLDFTASTGTGADLSYEFTIQKNNSNSTLVDAGEYTVNYTVKADNYDDATDSFTVVINKNAVTWTDPDTSDWGWTYGDADAAAPVDESNVSSLFAARFAHGTAAAGAIAAPTFAFFTDEDCTQSYIGGFNSETNAGTYYVKVSIAGTSNYDGYEKVYSFTVAQKEVTVNWSASTITQNVAMGAQNYLEGYDPAIMEIVSGDFTADNLASDDSGWYVTVPSDDLKTYTVTIALLAPGNYDWPGDSENANRTILFSVSATAITVTVTIDDWTYGDETVDGPSVTVTPTVTFDENDVVYAYAQGSADLEDAERNNLGYAQVADLTMLPAGSYWVRALVPAAEDNSYGMAFGYAHFTVSPYAIAKPTASGETFTYNGSTQTYMSGFDGTVTLPNGQKVTAMLISGNTGVDAGDYVATVRLASGNFVWTDNGDDPIRFDWTIAPQQLAMPTIGTLGTIDYMSTYTPGADQSLQAQRAELFGFNAELMSFSVTTGASYADGYVAANNVGTYTVTISFKQIAGGNYCWTGGAADSVTLTWTIDPATYELGDFGFGDDVHEFVYNGQPQYPTLGNPPTGIRVTGYAGSATNVSDGEQAVTAALALVGPYATNFRFENGNTKTTIEGSVQITPAQIESVVWSSQNNFTYTGQDLSGNVHAYFIKADGSFGYLTVAVEGNDGFVNAGEYTFSVKGIENDDGNYEFATSCTGMTSDPSDPYTIEKAAVTVVVEDPSDVIYTGEAPDLDTLVLNEHGYYGFTLIGADGKVIKMDQLPQDKDKTEWLAYAAEVTGSSPWNVGDYIVTVAGGTLTNYTIAYIETSTVTVTPAPITGITITVPNDNMVYGELTAADAAYIDPNSTVTVLLGGTTEATITFSEIASYIDLWYSGYTDGQFATNVNAGTVWVFPLMNDEAGTCNYAFTDSSAFAKEFTVHKKTIDGDDFSVKEVYYTGAPQTLPRDNVAYDGDVTAFANIFEDAELVVLSSGSYTAVGDYGATLTMADSVYRNYCFANGSYALQLAWEIVPIGAGQVSVTAPTLSVTDWGVDTEASVLVTVDSSATIVEDGTPLSVAAFRYEYQMQNASGEWVDVTVGSDFVWTAGRYQVRGIIADANFPAVASDWSDFTVDKGTYNTDVLTWESETFLYDGTEHNLTLRVGDVPDADGLLTAAQLHAADGFGLTYEIGDGLAAVGSQQVTVTITATSPNYAFEGGETTFTLTATITVEGRQVSVVWEGGSFTYNGTDQSAGVTAYFYDANNQRVDLKVSPDRAFVDAGDYTFTASGAPAGYILSGEQEDFTIAPAAAAVVWPADNFTYNGENQFGSVSAYFVDVNGEQVALALGTFEFRNVNAGGYTFEVVGAANEAFNLNNYELSGTTQVLHISPLAVTVTADDKEVAYGDTAALTWSASSDVFVRDEEDGLVTVSLTREAGDAMGEYTIFISVSGATSNYTLTTVDGTYTIMQQTLHLQIRLPADRVYDGRPVSATLVGIGGAVPSGVYLYYNGTANDGTSWSSASAPTKAGTYTVSAYTSNASLDIVCSPVRLVIERAAAVIDVSGVQTQYTYTGAQQTVDSGAVLNHSETQLVYSNNTFTTVAEGDGLRVRIDAAQTCNYEAGTAFVTITVERQSIGGGLSVVIEDWTYGEDANDYRLSGNLGGGAVTTLYTGTTNAGEAYESGEAPTEAGEYILRVTVAATANYAAGSASDTFTVLRAEPELTLTIEGWTYGREPNDFALTPALFVEYIQTVYYTDGTLYFAQPPTEVGSYTLIVEVAQSPNYEAGSAQAHFVITFAGPELSVTIEGWTYGEQPNAPVVQAEEGSAVTLRYTGTANDGSAWDSSEAPAKAGSYTLTATATNENFITETVTCAFIVARAPVAVPSLGEEGAREAAAVYDGEAISVVVVGYDGARMQPSSEALFELKDGQMKLVANAEGVYTVTFTLTDADNYMWAAEAGEDFSQGVVLTWTVTEKVDSLLWLIILLLILAVILLALLIVLIVQNRRAARRPDDDADGANGADGADGADPDPLYAMAPMGLLVVPAAHIAAVTGLAIVVVGLLVADILLFVRLRRLVKEADAAAEAAEADAYAADAANVYAGGEVNNYADGEVNNYADGDVNNYAEGEVNNYADGEMNNYAGGEMNNYAGGEMNNYADGDVNNYADRADGAAETTDGEADAADDVAGEENFAADETDDAAETADDDADEEDREGR